MRKHYDIAVTGVWYGWNYGSLLNGYSTYKLFNSLGLSVLMINKPNAQEGDKELTGTHNARFVQKYYDKEDILYPFMPIDRLHELNTQCDTFCAGSDQIWNHGLNRWSGKSFMLSFADDNKRKISLSTSFGHQIDFTPKNEISENRRLLERFNAISLREQNGVDICRDNYGVEATLINDPVLCIDKSIFYDLADRSNFDEPDPYIITYILDPTPEIRAAIQYCGDYLNIKVINILDGIEDKWARDFGKLNLPNTLKTIGAEDFLKAFICCSYVITDSFHGTVFSTLFNKPFATIANKNRGLIRFQDYLGRVGLTDRLIINPLDITDNKKIFENIDYTPINRSFISERERSIEWIKNALAMPVDRTVNLALSKAYYGKESFAGKRLETYNICPKNICTGCSACKNICAVDAIVMVEDNEGFVYPKIDMEKCVECGRCSAVCPVLHPSKKVVSNKPPINIYAAYSLDEETRFMSTSGGAFSEFAHFAFSQGGVVYGAAYDEEFNVRHIRISDIDDLPKIRQSKYYQSEIKESYKNIASDLEENKYVLFCGTPCQCAGLDSFLGGDASERYPNLVLLDFICHSVPSKKAFKSYLSELEEIYGSRAKRVWFKNKQNGWHNFSLRVDFIGKERFYIRTLNQDSFFKGFLKYRLFLRPACHECSFKGFRRAADITLADFWKLKWNKDINKDDQENGVSIIMTHTQKGQEIFDKYISKNMFSEKHTIEDVLKGNGLNTSTTCGLYRDYFFKNIDRFKFSDIISQMDAREALLAEQRRNAEPQIIGKLTKIGNVIIDMRRGSKIIIDEGGELICNYNLTKGSNKECEIILYEEAVFHVKGRLELSTDSVVKIFPRARLTIGGGFINRGAYISIARNTEIGRELLVATDLTLYDADHHTIVDASNGMRLNEDQGGVRIGDHVWIANNVVILKGAVIGSGSIISARSLVNKAIPERCLAVGTPAKAIKNNITWRG